jgi:steroid delta-isomerase-like uncharacterized protein
MNPSTRYSFAVILRSAAVAALTALALAACAPDRRDDAVGQNIKTYSRVWDEIINKGNLEMFNSTNFTTNVVMHASPKDVVGIDSARAYYANYVTGFTDIRFTIKDIFGQGDKLVKYWNFKGTHTGVFFGIPATGKTVDIDGTTLVRMENGKIAEERDFFDNLEFSQQLGLIPR